MIEIVVPKREYYNELTNEFIEVKETKLKMEHSLISIKNWEAKWNIAFLGKNEKTNEQMLDYLRCMTVHPGDVDFTVYQSIPEIEMDRISEYIKAPMSAQKFFYDSGGKTSLETITSEVIYYWMITLNIPMEFQKVHLNQLLTLIRLTSIKNTPPKKMSTRELLERNNRLNDERRKRLGTKG